jgi:hypothetical protein
MKEKKELTKMRVEKTEYHLTDDGVLRTLEGQCFLIKTEMGIDSEINEARRTLSFLMTCKDLMRHAGMLESHQLKNAAEAEIREKAEKLLSIKKGMIN